MSTKTVLLALLHEKNGSFVSGQDIASRLGVSRNAIWKAVKSLQEQGFEVESQAGVGYRLAAERDIISKDVLADEIKYPCSIHVFDKIDSTNNYAKKSRRAKRRSSSSHQSRLQDAAGSAGVFIRRRKKVFT